MRLIHRRDRRRQRRVLRAHPVAERDDQRLVRRHPRLVRVVGVPLGEEGRGGEESHPRRAQEQVAAGAEVGQVEHAGDAIVRAGLDDLDHLPQLVVVGAERRARGRKRRWLAGVVLAVGERHAERLRRALHHQIQGGADRPHPLATVVDDRVLRTERVVRCAGELRRIEDHVVRIARVERVGQRNRRAGVRGELEAEAGVRLRVQVDPVARVADLDGVEIRVQHHQPRRQHEPPRGDRRSERLAFADELQRGAGETFAQVRQQARVEPALRVAELIAEVRRDGLALLERVGEEAEHLRRVLGRRDPLLDQPAQRFRVGLDRLDLRVGRRIAGEQALHLGQRRGDRDRVDPALGDGPRQRHVELARAAEKACQDEQVRRRSHSLSQSEAG